MSKTKEELINQIKSIASKLDKRTEQIFSESTLRMIAAKGRTMLSELQIRVYALNSMRSDYKSKDYTSYGLTLEAKFPEKATIEEDHGDLQFNLDWEDFTKDELKTILDDMTVTLLRK